ncbi:MAG: ATP synthase F1 subunit delta [Nitrospiria bacterium]
MIKEVVARRYARALFEVINADLSKGDLDQTLEVLEEVCRILKEHTDFRHLMLNPRFDRATKLRVLRTLLESASGGEASGPVLKFFEHLVRKNRLQCMAEISRAFSLLVDQFQGVITVPIWSAREPSDEEKEEVRRRIQSVTGRTVKVLWAVNTSLIGGLMVRVGEAVVDGSVRGQLQAFRRRMVGA